MNTMSTFEQARQQAQNWSTRLGELAGGVSQNRQRLNLGQPAGPTPSRLSAVLAHLLQRSRAKERATYNLKAREFIMGD